MGSDSIGFERVLSAKKKSKILQIPYTVISPVVFLPSQIYECAIFSPQQVWHRPHYKLSLTIESKKFDDGVRERLLWPPTARRECDALTRSTLALACTLSITTPSSARRRSCAQFDRVAAIGSK